MTSECIKTIIIPALDATRSLTVDIKIKGLKTMQVRYKISSLIFRLAALIAGTKCKIEIELKKDE